MAEVTNDEANDLADEILGRSEFITARDAGFLERQVDRVLSTIGDFLGDIFGSIFGGLGGGAGTFLAYILLGLAAAVLIVAVVRAIRGRTAKPDGDEPRARIIFDEVVDPNELRAELARHRAAQDWRQSVIAGFRLSVLELIDAGIGREVPGATTGDYAVAVERRRPELVDRYKPAAAAFERAFYSDLAIEQSDLGAVDDLLGAMSVAGAR